jgi:hypothetical protein
VPPFIVPMMRKVGSVTACATRRAISSKNAESPAADSGSSRRRALANVDLEAGVLQATRPVYVSSNPPTGVCSKGVGHAPAQSTESMGNQLSPLLAEPVADGSAMTRGRAASHHGIVGTR